MRYLALWIFLFIVSALLTYVYLLYAKQKKWVDVPNERSSHTTVTPRGGGMVFMSLWLLAIWVGWMFYPQSFKQNWTLPLGVLMVGLTAFYDDRKSLSPKWRFLAYWVASLIAVMGMGGMESLQLGTWIFPLGAVLGYAFAVFSLVWSINLFNFMDGTDGLAATEALFVLFFGGLFLWLEGGYDLALSAWALMATVAGFLVWNKPTAKLFMGDVGSASLGFVIMMLAFLGEKHYGVPVLLWLILYGVFCFDATVTLLRRIYTRQKWYQPHKQHAYQRLHQSGKTHAQVLMAVMLMNFLLLILAWLGFYWRDWLILWALMALGLLISGYLWVESRKSMS